MTGLYTKFVTQLAFPLHEKLKSHTTVAVKNQLEKSQWWTREQLMAYQAQRLQALLENVNNHVPYYQRCFAEQGIDIDSIKSAQDLPQLPFLTKALIRQYSDDLVADNAMDLKRFNTGGSSGEPLVFYIGNERVSHDVAAKWRATRWWDVDLGDPEIVLWGSPIELGSQDYVRLIRDKVFRTTLLPAFEMTDAKLDSFIDEIQKRRPKMLFGYPSAFTLLAKHAGQRGVSLKGLGIKVVFVTSERLYDHQREAIETAFGCPVANGYGGRDAGFIAHQCAAGSMHVTAEDIIVEIIDQTGKVLPAGERGEIVVTHLATRHYPFIRYKTGDVGILSDKPCCCGRSLPVLAEIEGRTSDFIIAQDGTIMHGLALIYILRDLPEVTAFKIIQETRLKIRVQITAGEGFNDSVIRLIQQNFRQRLGEDVEVLIEQLATISNGKSGKFRYVVSHVSG